MFSVFFDIVSAFDKVWHNSLLIELISIKVSYYLINILMSFLSGRKLFVKVGEAVSTIRNAKCGVPQECVLSPTLFSIYINDTVLDEGNSFSILFANDLSSSIFYKSLHEVRTQMQTHLNKLETWSKKWRLQFAPHKCNSIVFSEKGKPIKSHFTYTTNLSPRYSTANFLVSPLMNDLILMKTSKNSTIDAKNELN